MSSNAEKVVILFQPSKANLGFPCSLGWTHPGIVISPTDRIDSYSPLPRFWGIYLFYLFRIDISLFPCSKRSWSDLVAVNKSPKRFITSHYLYEPTYLYRAYNIRQDKIGLIVMYIFAWFQFMWHTLIKPPGQRDFQTKFMFAGQQVLQPESHKLIWMVYLST